jgi:uncharacterized protein (DUF2164 family)
MAIQLPKDVKAQAKASLERFCQEHLDERIGNIAVGALLNFFIEEIGPAIYNQAVSDVQERWLQRVQELDIDVHEDPFTYWQRQPAAKGTRRR